MLFNSFEFLLLFLPLVLLVAFQLKGRALLIWITFTSFAFYVFAGELWFLIPMLTTVLIDFLVAFAIARSSGMRKKAWLMVSLMGNLGLLYFFKYGTWFMAFIMPIYDSLRWGNALKVSPIPAIILPAGISFYTFQTLSYIIDVYRNETAPEKDFWSFASFVSFFPHLVAGPLTRHRQLIPQLKEIADHGITPRWKEGLLLFFLGMAKKVLVADRIAAWSDPIIGSPHIMTTLSAWLGLLGFGLQIYFDFSGYSDMAIGLGRLLGIELPQNFNSPYQATDPSDFWRRWHITLSAWLRDYLYIPLGGSRGGRGRTLVNLTVTMALGGLWHGANWTYMIWGLYHGGLLVLYHLVKESWDQWGILWRRALTFLLVTLGWVFFRADSLTNAMVWFARLFGWRTPSGFGELQSLQVLAGGCAVGLFIVFGLPTAHEAALKPWSPWAQVGLGLLSAVTLLFMNYSSRFLYFQF